MWNPFKTTEVVADAVPATITALGRVIDDVFTSDEERANARIMLRRIEQQPALLNLELNKIEAGHRSIFVAGWRPFLGWVSGMGLAFAFLVNPLLERFVEGPAINVPTDIMLELVLAMLGLAGLRTVEKLNGKSK